MICSKCGFENLEGSIFCNQCGARLQTKDLQVDKIIEDGQPQEELQISNKDNISEKNNLKFNKLKNVINNKKVFIPTVIICCLLFIMCIGYLAIKPPSTDKVFNKIKDYETKEAISYLDKVYPNDGGFLGIFKKQNKKIKEQF